MIEVLSVNVGKPETIHWGENRKMRSSLMRKPIIGKIFVDAMGFAGDKVADPVHHGGPDKAVCLYSADHFPYWENELSIEFKPAAFGENVTLKGLVEKDVCIGDVFRWGEVELQVTQPRQPCIKLNRRFNHPQFLKMVRDAGKTGFYCRVLKQGWVETGQPFERIKKDSAGFSIEDANHLMYFDKKAVSKIQEILALQSLSESWREFFQNRLKSLT